MEVEFGGGKNPWYSKITPGIATFANNPSGAGPYLKPLLDYAASTVIPLSSAPPFHTLTTRLLFHSLRCCLKREKREERRGEGDGGREGRGFTGKRIVIIFSVN
jgi:hypothetical protein